MASELSVEEQAKLLETEKRIVEEEKKQIQQQRRALLNERKLCSEELQKNREQLERREAAVQREEERLLEISRGMANTEERVSQPSVNTGCYGTIKEFKLSDDWSLWCERLEQYIIANDVPTAKHVALLLTLMGTESYALLRNLCSPALPSSKTKDQLTEIMKNHLKPKTNIIMERYRFKECRQKEGVSVKEYIAQLKKLSIDCDFGENLESSLRDQLVWGLRSDGIKKKLLGEQDLTYARSVQIATAMEAATRDVAEMGPTSGGVGETVNFVGNRKKPISSFKPFPKNSCLCCGRSNHSSSNCKFKNYSCHVCHSMGHLANVCQKKNKIESTSKHSGNNNNNNNFKRTKDQKKSGERHHYVDEERELEQTFDNIFCVREEAARERNIQCEKVNDEPMSVVLTVQGEDLEFEIDTGSPITAVSVRDFNKSIRLSKLTILATERKFKSHAGQAIVPRGLVKVDVVYEGKEKELELFVLPGQGPPIVGRFWIRSLQISVLEIKRNSVERLNSIAPVNSKELCKRFPTVFSGKLGRYTKGKFTLHVKENVQPIFCKTRPIPYALRAKVDKELDRLTNEGIIVPVESSQWATPIVPVLKSNGQIRICGDYKITVNPHLKIDRHPIPRVQDLLATLNGGKIFSKLDLSNAYLQVELEEKSQELVTITTHKGLFRYKRLCFGVSSAPGLFQREVEKILQGIDGVVSFFDDILVSGATAEEHLERLLKVLERFRDCGLTVREEKCFFFRDSVSFLGYVINAQGSTIAREKVQAVLDVPAPHGVTTLKAFLGMINYYSKFIKNYAMIVNPLYELLRADTKWQWTRDREKAFNEAKKKLVSHEVLVHYDSHLPIKITCDASPVGLGAVLSHIYPDGIEKPIAFVSKSLTKTERNYSQLDREALGLVFGVKSFHQYVYGRDFILETDHKPLVYIFGSKKGLPQMAANRVQRWAVFLSGYNFSIKHIRGIDNGNADSLSRCPLPLTSGDFDEKLLKEYSYLNYVLDNVSAIRNVDIKLESSRDPVISKVLLYLTSGFPQKVGEEIVPFKNRERELTIVDGILMWGHRVVVPQSLRRQLISELHSIHMGVIRMKMIARSYIWWPGIDNQIEKVTKSCEECLTNADNPPRAKLNVWKWPEGPNDRVHADFLGPIEGKMYLIIIDAYSKWVDVKEMSSITSEQTIKAFQEYLSIWGLPKKLVTDNGPSFVSRSFEEFLDRNGIVHIRTAPYHPASNGAAENAVRTFKSKFKLLLNSGLSRHEALCRYLMLYRATPHCTTGVSPAELQIGRVLRTRLDLIRPSVLKHVEKKQTEQKRFFRGNRSIEFSNGEFVMAKDYSNNLWCKAEIIDKIGPVTYRVRTDDNRVWKRHADQLNKCNLFVPNVLRSPIKRDILIDDLPLANNVISDVGVSSDGVSGSMVSENEKYAPEGSVVPPFVNSPVCNKRQSMSVTSANRVSVARHSVGVVPTSQDSVVVTPEVSVRRSSRNIKPRQILDL